jgi:hypothetical protein
MRALPLVLAFALAACGQPAEDDAAGPTPSPATPSPTAADMPNYTPPELTPEAAKGEKGARNVLLSWAQAMEDRAFDAAYALYGVNGPETAAEFAARFADYQTITVALGDGVVEGAAGSLYYEVPATLTGTAQGGSSYRREGTIVLRRVNDVPGAGAWQLAWHIERIEWQAGE